MKKVLVAAALACAIAFSATAAQGKKAPLTDDQKALMKEMLAKYDTNKDGKLDKDEKSKISQEDKDKMTKAGLLGGGHKKKTDSQ